MWFRAHSSIRPFWACGVIDRGSAALSPPRRKIGELMKFPALMQDLPRPSQTELQLRSSRGESIEGDYTRPLTYTPQCTAIKGLMVSIRWYLGSLKG